MMHDVEAIGIKMDIPIIAFVKALYPTYYHYLQSLQVSSQLKDDTFDTLVEAFARREKAFGKRNIAYQSHE